MRALLLPFFAAGWLVIGAVHLATGGLSAAGLTGTSPSAPDPRAAGGPTLKLTAGWGLDGAPADVRVGTSIWAIGSGFHPGARVSIAYAVAETGFGRAPVAQAVVGSGGGFVTSFTITPAIAVVGPGTSSGRYPGPAQPVLFVAREELSQGAHRGQARAAAALVVDCAERAARIHAVGNLPR